MIRIPIDKFLLGAIAEESGTPILIGPERLEREDYVEANVTILCGNRGQIQFYAPVKRSDGVVPPEFREGV